MSCFVMECDQTITGKVHVFCEGHKNMTKHPKISRIAAAKPQTNSFPEQFC